MVLSLMLGLAAVLLEPYFLPGIWTGFHGDSMGIQKKIGVYRGLILPPIVPEVQPRYYPDTAGILPGYFFDANGVPYPMLFD
jgi:hypothetical protein